MNLSERLNLRGGASLLMLTYKDTINGVDFDMDLDLFGALGRIDFYPWEWGEFRISAGLAINYSEVDVRGRPRRDTKIGDNVYTPQQTGTIRGTAEFNVLAPYLGIGYGNAVRPDSCLTFVFDFGFMIQTYDLSLRANGTAKDDPTFKKDLGKLRSDIGDVLDWMQVFPIISFGLSYQF